MVILTSIVSIALVAANSRIVAGLSPARVVPATFAVSAVLLLVEWMLMTPGASSGRRAGLSAYRGSRTGAGFRILADCKRALRPTNGETELQSVSPGPAHSAGLAGGLLAERLGVWFGVIAVLPFLAVLNVLGAWAVHHLATAPLSDAPLAPSSSPPDRTPADRTSGLHLLINVPYIRNLAALVLLGTTSATLIDYVFKAEAVSAFGRGESLLALFCDLLHGNERPYICDAGLVPASSCCSGSGSHSRRACRPRRCWPAASSACSCPVSRASPGPAAANRFSAALFSALDTSCFTRRFRPEKNAR